MDINDLRKATKWSGEYKDITFEIYNHGESAYHKNGIWCFYIFFPVNQFPPSMKKEIWLKDKYTQLTPTSIPRLTHDYYKSSIGNADYWSGGCTFYERTGNKYNQIGKFGCDYAHSWDEEYMDQYDLGWILDDVKKAIREIHRQIPGIKKKCSYCGKFDLNGLIKHNKLTCSKCVRNFYLKGELRWINQ